MPIPDCWKNRRIFLFVALALVPGTSLLSISFGTANRNTEPQVVRHRDTPVQQEEEFVAAQKSVPQQVTFNAHIRPIMSNTCFACHGPDETANESGVRLDSFEAAVTESGAIEPGNASGSPVYQRLMDEDDPMPPAEFRHQLSHYEKALFKAWIDQGAEYQEHWSYAAIRRPAVPEVPEYASRIANPVDAFILTRLAREGIKPTPLADKGTLLRRLCLDLTGLPPTVDELDAFLADDSPDAYEKQVERLLVSPRYGERMAAAWLDIVRFSDTVGFHGDQNQRIFPYRDYVIQSINDNQPFDEFTREQLAGDLLTQPTDQQLIATGLIRLNMMTREGGAQPGEYLAKYTADRVRMIGTAWLGATTGCCECHNHKYDPFTARDFYSLGAFFDDVRQWGVYSNYHYTPNPDLQGFNNDYPFPPEIRVPSESLISQIRFLEKRLNEVSASASLEKEVNRESCLVALNQSEPRRQWLSGLLESYRADPSLWHHARPEHVTTNNDTPVETMDDGSLLFQGEPQAGQTTSISLRVPNDMNVRALKMEVLPSDSNGGHVGRGNDGRFSASLSVTLHPDVDRPESSRKIPVRPRYVRIELDGRKILSLAEVQVFGKNASGHEINLAAEASASQSSVEHDGEAQRAIDGNTSGDYRGSNSTTHTVTENNPWWELDLGEARDIDRVSIWNRTDGSFPDRLRGFRVVLLDENRKRVCVRTPDFPSPSIDVLVPPEVSELELLTPAKIAFAQANRSNPARYSSGRPSAFLPEVWQSGPSKWQLPADETRLPHVAVYHLNQSIPVKPTDRLLVKVNSNDVGRIRFSVSPVSRPVVADSAGNESLVSALASLDRSTALSSLTRDQLAAIMAACYQYETPYDRQVQSGVQQFRNEIADCRSGLAMSMVSQPVEPERLRQSRILPRGDWQDESGDPVSANTPQFLAGHNPEPGRRLTRLDLANWLTDADNPLTARHYVNRTWKHFFGRGLSGNLDDLGNQGEWPSHPQLLDWLAHEFRSTWDRKQVARLIVTSNTYRQQAAVRNDLQDVDPYNRLLAQQSARRLEAEIVRDNALSISGLLQADWIGGPSVFPHQPTGYYANLQFPNRRYVSDKDGRQYRRGVYMHWQRTFLHPMLTNFDAPSRDECVADRTQSNSPQQALTLLNDPSFVEASRAFASRLLRENPKTGFKSRLQAAFRLALARDPGPEEIEALNSLYDAQLDYYSRNREEAEAFHGTGQFSTEEGLDIHQLAALSQVCRVILNLHETITRF